MIKIIGWTSIVALTQVIAFGMAFFGATEVLANDSRLSFPKQFSLTAQGVNVQTGRFMMSSDDLIFGPFTLKRSWGELPSFPIVRSFGPPLSMFNQALQWSHNYIQGSYLDTRDSRGNLVIFVVDGAEYRFRIDPNLNMLPQDKSTQGNRLTRVSGRWNLVDRQGNLFVFQTHASLSQYGMSITPQQLLMSATYANGSRITYSYNSSGQIRFAVSNLGYALVFDYNGQGNISAVCGYNLTLNTIHSGTTCSGSSFKVLYGYDSSSTRLTSVTDPGSGIVNINYTIVGNAPLPVCITLRNSSTCSITNSFGSSGTLTLPDQTTTQTTATGDVWTYQYGNGVPPEDVPIIGGQPRWTWASFLDGAGQSFFVRFDRGLAVDSATPQGTFKYRYPQYSYSEPSATTFGIATVDYRGTLPRLITTPDGDAVYYEHNYRGEVTKKVTMPRGTNVAALTLTSGEPLIPSDEQLSMCCTNVAPLVVPSGSLVELQSFLPDWGGVGLYGQVYVMGCGIGPADDKRCSKPVTHIDANGFQTDYEYSAVHGGIVSETAPAPTPGGVRPQIRYSYVQRQAYVLGAGGTVVAAGPPVWLLAAKSMCKTSQWTGSACSAPNDEVRTTYEYGPTSGLNNLNLRGEVVDADGLALRTCYAYDWRGLRTSVTTPRAGLGVCP